MTHFYQRSSKFCIEAGCS